MCTCTASDAAAADSVESHTSAVVMTQPASENATLSHRAEVFRSKLIEDFQLLESISEHGQHRAPVYNSSDVTGTDEIVQP